ncbi:MAG: hypothetical protein LBR30_07870, partial [Clostridioides sp.]|nr:hypothetical protein [Clostridioides sp.]
SPTNPISVSLLCLDFDIDFEEKCKIFNAFRKVITSSKFEDLSIDLFRKELVEFVPKTEYFSDLTIVRFMKAYSIHMITELYPYACLAEAELGLY